MSPSDAGLDLAPGACLMLDGEQWTVESFAPELGRVLLRDADGRRSATTVRMLIGHRGTGRSAARDQDEVPAASRGRQPAMLADLRPEQAQWARLRFEHVQEAETGFRSGDPWKALPGEPRPAYNPQTTTLTERRRAKVAELRALGRDEARMIGFGQVSERTLKRLGAGCRRHGIAACIKGSWLRRSGRRPSVTEEIREAIHAVRRETLHRARVSMKTRERMVHQYVRENFGPDVAVPSYPTLRRVWVE